MKKWLAAFVLAVTMWSPFARATEVTENAWLIGGNFNFGVTAVFGTSDASDVSMIHDGEEWLLRTGSSFELFWNGVQAMSIPDAGSSRTVNFVSDLSDPASNANMQVEGGVIGETHYQVSRDATSISRWGWTTAGLTFPHTHITFNGGGASGPLTFEDEDTLDEWMRIQSDGKVGIGDASPASLFTVGNGDLFQVSSIGDIVAIRGQTMTWPAANASGVLSNNGSGTLSWVAAGAPGGGLPAGTNTHTLRYNGTAWVSSGVLTNDGTNIVDTGNFTAQGSTHVFGTTGTTTTLTIGQGIAGTDSASARISSGSAGGAGANLFFARGGLDVASILVNAAGTQFMIDGTLTWQDASALTIATMSQTGATTWNGATHVFGVAGTATTMTVGQGTTGTDTAKIVARSGNSGTTAPTFALNRNGTDIAQWTFNGTDTFDDYTGTLTWRTGIAGSTRATLTSTGNFSAVGTTHLFGATPQNTTVTVGAGTGGTNADQATLILNGGNNSAIGSTTFFKMQNNGLDTYTLTNSVFGSTNIGFILQIAWQDLSSPGTRMILSSTGTDQGATLTVGTDTTGTDVGIVRARSGNSGTTAVTMALNRNNADIAQWTSNGTDTFEDYVGVLTWRTGIAGTTRMSLSAAGFFNVIQSTSGNETARLEAEATNDNPNIRYFQGRSTTAGAASATPVTFQTVSGEVYLVEQRGHGKCTSGSGCTAGNTIACVRRALYRNVAGTVTEVNEAADYTAADGDMGGSCNIAPSGTTITFNVTGAANENITWHNTVIIHSFGT